MAAKNIPIEDRNNVLRAVDPEYIVAGMVLSQAFQIPGPGISVLVAEYADPNRFAEAPFTRFTGWRCAKANVGELRTISARLDDIEKATIDVFHKPSIINPFHAEVNAVVNGRQADRQTWIRLETLSLRSRIAEKFFLMPNVTITPTL